MNQKRLSLIIAIALALGTGFLTLNYLSSARSTTAFEPGRRSTIVVAATDIPARVAITRDMLRAAQRDPSQLEPDALTDPQKAIGSYSLISIPADASITASKIGRPQTLGLAAVVKPGMRAVSIGIDKVKGVSDLILPGDRVDVIAVATRVGSETPVASTILRGAIVLALGSQLETAAPAPGADSLNVATVTLGVTPAQANILTSADINSTLRLALRSPREPLNSLLAQPFVLPAAQSAPVAPAAFGQVAPLRASTGTSGVQVIDGNGGPS